MHDGSDTGRTPSSEDLEMSILSDSESDSGRSDEEDEETGLTRKRQRRRRTGRNHNLLSSDTITADKEAEEKLATATLVKNTVINVLLIGLWYTFSISIRQDTQKACGLLGIDYVSQATQGLDLWSYIR